MHAESVADHSRHRVQRLQNCVVHRLLFLILALTDRYVLLNGDDGNQCWQQPEWTILSDKMVQFHVRTCKRWCRSCTLFADELVASVDRRTVSRCHVVVIFVVSADNVVHLFSLQTRIQTLCAYIVTFVLCKHLFFCLCTLVMFLSCICYTYS